MSALQAQRQLNAAGFRTRGIKPFRPIHRCSVSVQAASAALVLRRSSLKLRQAEQAVLDALSSAKGRGKDGLSEEQLEQLNQAVAVLEADGGVIAPTTTEQLDGSWRLLYTSRPGSASPIQRTFVGVDAFSVYQEVDLQGELPPRVNNVVDFGPNIGYLKVEAEASIDSRPLEGFTPRQGQGLPLFGKSFNTPPSREAARIDFQFDRAAFTFKFLPFTLPYPVPFRLLGDERKGWIDVTYMNGEGSFRLSRGNKGTLFVLAKDVPPRGSLLQAIEEGDDQFVMELIPKMQALNPTPDPAESELVAGTWRLVWSQQAETASPLQKWGSKQANSFQVIDAEDGSLQNLVDLGFVKIRAYAECSAASGTRTDVNINKGELCLGPVQIPLPVGGSPGYVDWLYLDESVRITRGSKGSVFVHLREVEEEQE